MLKKTIDVNLTLVASATNGKELTFTGDASSLKFNVYSTTAGNKDYTLDQLLASEEAILKAIGQKINDSIKDNKITVSNDLLTTAEWTKIKQNGDFLRAYRITVKDTTSSIGKIAMYENGTAVIEK